MIDQKKLFNVISEWETEAALAEKDGKPAVAFAIRALIQDLYNIFPLGELNVLFAEQEKEDNAIKEPYKRRNVITGDHRF